MTRIRWLVLFSALGSLGGCLLPSNTKSAGYKVTVPVMAKNTAREAPDLPPKVAAEACLATARELEAKGCDAEAADQYLRARKFAPNQEGVAWRLAVLFGRNGYQQKAAEEFAVALKEQPKEADLHNDAGYFFAQNEQWLEAEKHLRRAIELDRKHRQAWINLGTVLGKTGRDDESLKAFAQVLKPAEASYNVGLLAAARGNHDRGRSLIEKALAQDPKLPNAAIVLTKLERTGE